MKKSLCVTAWVIAVMFDAGFADPAVAQGIRNEGAAISMTSGYLVCQGGFANNAGTFASGTGTVVFTGSEPKTLSGAGELVFYNLVVDASGGNVTIPAGTRVTVTGSNFSPGGKLIIMSDAVDNSGSLIYSGSGTPTGDVTYSRVMPAGSSWHYVSSPVTLTSSPTGSFYSWDEVAGDWDTGTTATPASGRGYALQTTGNSVSFTGTVALSSSVSATSPYTTDYGTGYPAEPGSLADYNARWAIGRTVYGGGGWNLLGNPFTSALRIGGDGGFLDGNDGNGTIATNRFDPNYVAVYIYDGDSYNFRGRTTGFEDPVLNETPPNEMFGFDNIQAGQGFFVLAMKSGVSFAFDRSMQTHGPATTMMKSAVAEGDSWPGLRLKVKCDGSESSTLVVYNDEMTAGLDPGYDVGQLSANPDVEIYTSLVAKDNSVNFAQQALPVEGHEKNIIPVGIDSEKGGEVIFSAYTVPIEDKKFWLEDRVTGIFTNLNTNAYTVTIPAKTFGTGRFFIVASANTPTGIGNLQPEDTGLRIWTAYGKIIIRGEVSDRAVCTVYDVRGDCFVEKQLTDGELNVVSLPSGLHGVYIVGVIDGTKVTNRKIVL